MSGLGAVGIYTLYAHKKQQQQSIGPLTAAPAPLYLRVSVAPYLFTYRTKVKPRWVGQSVGAVFSAEFQRYAAVASPVADDVAVATATSQCGPSLLQRVAACGHLRVVHEQQSSPQPSLPPVGGVSPTRPSLSQRPRGMTKKQFQQAISRKDVAPLSGAPDHQHVDTTGVVGHLPPPMGDTIVFVEHVGPRRGPEAPSSSLGIGGPLDMGVTGSLRAADGHGAEDPAELCSTMEVDTFLFHTPLLPTDTILHSLHKHEPDAVFPLLPTRRSWPTVPSGEGKKEHVKTAFSGYDYEPVISILNFIAEANVLVVAKPSGIPTLPSGCHYFNSLTAIIEHALMPSLLRCDGVGASDPPGSDAPETLLVRCSASIPASEKLALIAFLEDSRKDCTIGDHASNFVLRSATTCDDDHYDDDHRSNCSSKFSSSRHREWRASSITAHPLHRLDTGTSGVVALRLLRRRQGTTALDVTGRSDALDVTVQNKRYIAHVHGDASQGRVQERDARGRAVAIPLAPHWYRCDLPMVCVGPSRYAVARDHSDGTRSLHANKGDELVRATGTPSHRVAEWASGTDGIKDAVSDFTALCSDDALLFNDHGRSDNSSFVGCVPVTGRTHQLRVHLAALGYPIVGDEAYGRPHVSEAEVGEDDANIAHSGGHDALCQECAAAPPSRTSSKSHPLVMDSFHLHALSCEVHLTRRCESRQVCGTSERQMEPGLKRSEAATTTTRSEGVVVVRCTAAVIAAGLPSWCPPSVAAALLPSAAPQSEPLPTRP